MRCHRTTHDAILFFVRQYTAGIYECMRMSWSRLRTQDASRYACHGCFVSHECESMAHTSRSVTPNRRPTKREVMYRIGPDLLDRCLTGRATQELSQALITIQDIAKTSLMLDSMLAHLLDWCLTGQLVRLPVRAVLCCMGGTQSRLCAMKAVSWNTNPQREGARL